MVEQYGIFKMDEEKFDFSKDLKIIRNIYKRIK